MRIILRDQIGACWRTFSDPVEILFAREPAEVLPTLRRIEQRVAADNLWAAGFVCYEAAPGFDSACTTLPAGELPLLVFGLYDAVTRTTELTDTPNNFTTPSNWQLDTAQHTYMRNVERIREHIALGNTYQVNYTIRGHAEALDEPWKLFLAIARDAPLAAYVETDDYAIVSASPELCFRLDGEQLTSRPMKGTATRGLSAEDDRQRRRQLAESAKDRAENIMIADMLRNDMGRIAEAGSVEARSLFDIEKYPTVWQATSTITARSRQSLTDIFTALFPCASITGAPKIASMKLISQLERSPRGVYSGAIGFVAPGRRAQFSVAIRTVVVDRHTHRGEYGVGSGIVWDSQPGAEYAECLAKGRILRQERPPADMQLIETLLWTRSAGYFLLDRHLLRLQSSADYFDFRIDMAGIAGTLHRLADTLHNEQHRVRLLVSRDGACSVTETAICLPRQPAPARIGLARKPVDADNVFLYHKTTHRKVYEDALHDIHDVDDALLWNSDGFVTESTIANVAVRIGKRLYTPPVRCGLLPGTLREWLLESGELEERPIRVAELADAEEIVLFNSVRHRYTAVLQ